MKRITLLTSRIVKIHAKEDLLLLKELSQRGYQVNLVPWEDFRADSEDLVMIRTTWNYTDHYDKFLQTLEGIEDCLWNPLSLVKWNSNKKYLIDLYRNDLPVIPLAIIKDSFSLNANMESLGGDEFIIKPLIGASANGLIRFNSNHLPIVKEEVILQKFYPEIHKGEVSLIYYNHEFSHAVIKKPTSGDIRVQSEYGGTTTNYIPSADDLEIATAILKHIPHKWLYARVDIIPGLGLMELECIEPELFLFHEPKSSHLLADAMELLLR